MKTGNLFVEVPFVKLQANCRVLHKTRLNDASKQPILEITASLRQMAVKLA